MVYPEVMVARYEKDMPKHGREVTECSPHDIHLWG